jgi:hypothetical protein
MLCAFPFCTFDEIAALGLEVVIECPTCYRKRGPIDLADERLSGRRFTDVRFACTGKRNLGTAFPPRPFGGSGHFCIRPPARDVIRPGQSIPWCEIACPRCVPCWEVAQAAKYLPPWKAL